MKLKVKSQADLKRVALATGAELEYQGGKFNTTLERIQAARPEPEAEVVAVAPVEAPAKPASMQESFTINLDMEPVAQAIDSGNEKVCKAIAEAVKEIHVPASQTSPCSWIFTVKRDTRGFIQTVEASPKV